MKKKDKEVIQINYKELSKGSWNETEEMNVRLVLDFVQKLMNDHDFEYVKKTFGNNNYKQHNRSMNEGIGGVIEYVSSLVKRFPEYTYDVKHIYADGDHVIFHSHSTINSKHRGNADKGVNIFDTWKVRDGKIIEHWDAIQAVDGFMRAFALFTGGKVRNSNTLY